ncbi:hypothetical protein Tco_0869145 [Tanacetum coccineum]
MLLPSTTYRDDLLEADMPLWKTARFTALTGRFEVGESSSAVAARQARHTLSHRVDYGFIDTFYASICAVEGRAMTAIGVVNERVTDLVTTHRQETHELQRRYFSLISESRSQATEAHIRALQRDVDLVRSVEAGPQDGPADAGISC